MLSADHTEPLTDVEFGTTVQRHRRSRNPARRQMSKSEPATHLESYDGTNDSDITAVSSGEGSQQQRRVSAPNDAIAPPNTRRKRSRQWRLKSRTGESSRSASGTTTSDESGSASNAHPTLSHAHPEPAPSDVPQSTTTTIRFAPGC